MFNIEHKIKKSASDFDFAEPPVRHEAIFRHKLRKQADHSPLRWMRPLLKLKIAAILLVALSIPGFYMYYSGTSDAKQVSASELTETNAYYEQITQQKLAELEQIAAKHPSTKQNTVVATNEIKKLRDESARLNREYVSSHNDQRVFNALVYNFKSTVRLLETLITQTRYAQGQGQATKTSK